MNKNYKIFTWYVLSCYRNLILFVLVKKMDLVVISSWYDFKIELLTLLKKFLNSKVGFYFF